MKKLKRKLITKARLFVKKQFRKIEHTYPYHNMDHTKGVVKAAIQIARKFELNKDEYITLMVSAWFHDTGFLLGNHSHEERSAEIVRTFLVSQGVNDSFIPAFEQAILATRIPQNPTNRVEEILCDADLFHLGTKEFFKNSKSLRKEYQLINGVVIGKRKWIEKDISLMKSQRYFTEYARKILDKELKKNLNKLLFRQKALALAEIPLT